MHSKSVAGENYASPGEMLVRVETVGERVFRNPQEGKEGQRSHREEKRVIVGVQVQPGEKVQQSG